MKIYVIINITILFNTKPFFNKNDKKYNYAYGIKIYSVKKFYVFQMVTPLTSTRMDCESPEIKWDSPRGRDDHDALCVFMLGLSIHNFPLRKVETTGRCA